MLTNKSSFIQPKITIQMFPKGEYKTPLQYLTTIVSIYMVMAFSPYILFLLTFVVTEKEKKIKEAMKIMGLSTYAFWLGWFITYAVVISIGVAFVTIIAAVSKLFGDSDYFIIFLFFLFYGLSIETLSFMLTPLFQKGRTAGMAGSMGTIVLSTLSMIHIYLKTSNAVKWVTGFLSPVALSLALTPALDTQGGVTWSNIATKGDFPALYGLILLIIDTILYLLLAVYFDSVFPGEYGQRKHPLFCFKLSYWKSLTQSKEKNKRQMSFMRSHSVKEDEQTGDVEEAPEELLDRKVIRYVDVISYYFAPSPCSTRDLLEFPMDNSTFRCICTLFTVSWVFFNYNRMYLGTAYPLVMSLCHRGMNVCVESYTKITKVSPRGTAMLTTDRCFHSCFFLPRG